jgi:lysophospholipase L1-like esterase
MSTLVALGDSISCGEGVGVGVPSEQTWVGLLARWSGMELDLLATAGARAADLRSRQVPQALARPADLITVLIGLNDVIRSRFDADLVSADLVGAVGDLRAHGAPILVARLHDPTLLPPIPAPLRTRLRRRVAVINAAVDSVAGNGVHVVDLAGVPALRDRAAWAVDRLHPAPAGHRAMARAAAAVSSGLGVAQAVPAAAEDPERAPRGLAELHWVARHGAPYLLTHLGEMALPMAALLVGRAA